MGNNGSKTPEAENNGEQQSRESVSPPGAKRYPLRPQSLIGVNSEPCTGNHGETTHLACGQVKGKTQPVSTGEHGMMSGGDLDFPSEIKQAGAATKRTPGDVPGVTTRNDSTGDDVNSGTDHTCRIMADPGTSQFDTATGGIIDNCRDKHGNSSYNIPHAARSFDARNDTCEKTTVSYQPVINCTEIKMVDNNDQLLGTRRDAFGKGDAHKEGMIDRKVCTVRQPETRTRQSPDGESMKLDLNPNEENAMFVHKESVSLSVVAEGSSDHLDSGGQKDDRDDLGLETDQPQPVDVAGSPLQYEDCVEYIESGHTDSLPDVIGLAADRPETEGREVLLDRSIEKEGDNSMEEVNSAKSKDKSSAVSIHSDLDDFPRKQQQRFPLCLISISFS